MHPYYYIELTRRRSNLLIASSFNVLQENFVNHYLFRLLWQLQLILLVSRLHKQDQS